MNKRSLPPPPSQRRFAGLVEPITPSPLRTLYPGGTHSQKSPATQPVPCGPMMRCALIHMNRQGFDLVCRFGSSGSKKHTNGGQVGRADDMGFVTLYFRHV
ncbi:hypothetical protein XPA_010372 [Xanthoria parietina]